MNESLENIEPYDGRRVPGRRPQRAAPARHLPDIMARKPRHNQESVSDC